MRVLVSMRLARVGMLRMPSVEELLARHVFDATNDYIHFGRRDSVSIDALC